jgi:PPOX class probable F420-dependent enzyme
LKRSFTQDLSAGLLLGSLLDLLLVGRLGSERSDRLRHHGRMPRAVATNTRVSRDELLDFVRPRHSFVLATTRSDGGPQLSPVTGGVSGGELLISSYPERAKVHNLRRTPSCSVLVLSDDFGGAWVQVDGTAEVVDMPAQEAEDGLVEYFRCISGEHPDWAEYREAMRVQEKSLIRVTPTRWGPVATGGFPARLAQ